MKFLFKFFQRFTSFILQKSRYFKGLKQTEAVIRKCSEKRMFCNFCRVVQPQINVETTLCISTLEFTTLSNVESTLRISTLMCGTLDNVETRLSFSTSSFTTLVNVETTLWNWPFLNGTKRKSFQIDYTEFKVFLVIT